MTTYFFDYSLYKKRLNKKTGLFIPVCILLIILLMVTVCFITPKPKTIKFYFVEVGNFMKYTQANSLALEIQQKNAAGYVYFDNTYHVFTSFYLNRNDAETVVKNIKNEYVNAKVFSLSTNKYVSYKSNTETETIKKVIKANESVIEQLYNNIIDYDKNEISKEKLNITLKKLAANYSESIEDFSETFKSNVKMTNIKENVLTIKNSVSGSADNCNLKYNLIKIVIAHYSFLDFLS